MAKLMELLTPVSVAFIRKVNQCTERAEMLTGIYPQREIKSTFLTDNTFYKFL